MKKSIIIFAIIIASFRANAQEHAKDTVRIERDRVELTQTEKGKPQFVLKSGTDKTKTRKVNTDKGSAERFCNGGTPYVIYNLNEF